MSKNSSDVCAAFSAIFSLPKTLSIDFFELFGDAKNSQTRNLFEQLNEKRAALCKILNSNNPEPSSVEHCLENYASLWFELISILEQMYDRKNSIGTALFPQYAWKGCASRNFFTYTSIVYESYMLKLCRICTEVQSAVRVLELEPEEALKKTRNCLELIDMLRDDLQKWITRQLFDLSGKSPDIRNEMIDILQNALNALCQQCIAEKLGKNTEMQEEKIHNLKSRIYATNAQLFERLSAHINQDQIKLYDSKFLESTSFLQQYYELNSLLDKCNSVYRLNSESNSSIESSTQGPEEFSAALLMIRKAREILANSKHKKKFSAARENVEKISEKMARLNNQIYFINEKNLKEEDFLQFFPKCMATDQQSKNLASEKILFPRQISNIVPDMEILCG